MNEAFWPAGEGGWIAGGRVVAIGNWDSLPIRRAARKAKAEGRLIDLTYGHACRWVIYLDSGHLVLTSQDKPFGCVPFHS